ncbi:cellulose biosynthesis cyclic di-GMP-binding regulatory protein BcsB [Nocardioides mangrovi]|uniref:Cellulose biosynthesis cyclic di-GMP-binding regulatory protein BcsB n=1 Tax=Nocardioides mangrovi TaxID=2874580 RepID=A0ABS7U9W5_9ACTN|nr:cellulose biosynthesis cyclic di-GMP-binding regulatory protein BcsB [Nocardioides mangrovi]MBZ5737783.1 cellulose biosynthesis cyclic di-GMP-binding regulatory protein BcsB [Nocardioides mangrovi]
MSTSGPSKRGNRLVPRGALVLLGIVVVLVLVFVFVRPEWLSGEADDASPDRQVSTTLSDIGMVDGLRLSDDNSTTQTVTMALPVDSTVGNPRLSLVGTTAAAEDSTVFLRVLADGQSVYVEQLDAGQHDLDADIPLPDSVAEDGSVRVQVRLTGSLDQRRCTITQELGALVVLDPDRTRVRGTLSSPLHTVRDVVADLDHDVTLDLAFPAGDTEWFETAARYAVALTQAGHEVTYRDVGNADDLPDDQDSQVLLGPADTLADLGWDAGDPSGDADPTVQVGTVGDLAHLGVLEPSEVTPTFLSTAAVTTADTGASSPRRAEPERLAGDGVTLESLGVDTSVQSLTDTRTWRAAYSLADLPDGSLPTRLRLEVSVPITTDDSRWLVQVQLNGQLLDSVRLPGDDAAQQVTLDLPSGLEALRNQLSITLLRDRDLGGCNVRQTTYQVQVLPSSRLVLGGTGEGFTAVPADYAGGFDVLLPSASAEDPATSLADLVPTLAELSGWEQDLAFGWDGTPGQRPFLLLGNPPADAPVQVADGRITAAGLDLQSFADGLVVQCVPGGVAVTAVGVPGDVVPPYARESARLVTGDGGGFVVSGSGRVVTAPPVRADPGG